MLRVERTYQRAVAARAEVEQMTKVAERARARCRTIDAELGTLPGAPGDRPMARLARRLALQPAQVEFLWAAVACSVDGRIVPHIEALGGLHARRGLSLSVHALMNEGDDGVASDLAHWLGAPNPVLDLALLSCSETASYAARPFLASARFVAFLSGQAHDLTPLRSVIPPADPLHDESQRRCIQDIERVIARNANAVIVLEGPRGSGRGSAAACALQGQVLLLDASRLRPGQLVDALVALRRETVLARITPIIANVDDVLGEARDDQRGVLRDFVDTLDGPLVMTSSIPGTDLGTTRPLVRLSWDVASVRERSQMWIREAGSAGVAVVERVDQLAHRYRVGPGAIRRAVASARMLFPEGEVLGEDRLATALRHNIAERLGGLARRIEVNQSWEDLVVAEDTSDQIAALIGRIRHAHQVLERWGYRARIARGAGVAALFSGLPGTGKTLVAGLVAKELDLELYQVDLSKVVSKWVGETEKHLARVFDAAEEGHALLLFDEADALFGQRSVEMKGAVDRYANLEVNYLLQRVEAFGGITILTTNLESAIDKALKRRLASHIVFAAPDEDERELLWQRQAVTADSPLASDVDFHTLARSFPSMTGANIRNAAIAAAFLAAGDEAPEITQEHLLRAARAEYRSMGHIVNELSVSRQRDRREG
jgi:SpoVK/Ycf46/Vps4 family AAA+-type ATPase